MSDTLRGPHRRLNLMTGEWVLVSPQRTQRPWLGEVERRPEEARARYDPGCSLCPGNERANGERNANYADTFVFTNDFAALEPDDRKPPLERTGLLRAEPESGTCRVLCFSPRHDLGLGGMEPAAIRGVVDAWSDQYSELGALPDVNWVQIFENRGAMMGASNPHPHGQLWAERTLPNEARKEQFSFLAHRERHGSCLLCDYIELEIERSERVVHVNESFAIVVPFWAVWPFETLLVSRRHATALDTLSDGERDSLACAISALIRSYDRLFEVPFPYTMGFHQRPTDSNEHEEWHLHAHYYPPLLRSATLRKFMVGYEMLGQPQRDITAESAAARLRAAFESTLRARRIGEAT